MLDLSGDTYDENEDINSLQTDTDVENYEELTQKVADYTEQLKDVFTSYTNSMAVDYSEDMLQFQIESYPNAPEQVRVNAALMTLDSFYDVYPEIQEGDDMYLAPEDRVKVW